ncbi:hypothetical protein QW180_03930 [Vibrio sinaloensis]|nr:hypothetical protein [Vibrio sinaloensis]
MPTTYAEWKNSEGYWMLSDVGLYQVSLTKVSSKQLLYRGKVHDLVEINGVLWLATDEGIKCIDAVTGEMIDDSELPLYLKIVAYSIY